MVVIGMERGSHAQLLDRGKARPVADATRTGTHLTDCLEPVRTLAANQREELISGLLLFPEAAEHSGCDRSGVLLFDAAHHHAEVAGFDHYADALRFDYTLDGLGDLRGHTLLDLQAAREYLDEARYLA